MGYWDYLTLLHELSRLLSVKTYLEVGVREGASLCAVLAKEPEICGFAQACLVEQDTFLTDRIIQRIGEAYTLRCPDIKLYLFDAWTYTGTEGGKERVTRLLAEGFHMSPKDFTFMDGDSKETLPKFFVENKVDIDLAFIDGFHDDETTLSDLENCLPRAKAVALHDMFYETHPLLPVFKWFVKAHGLPTLNYGADFYDTGVVLNMVRRL